MDQLGRCPVRMVAASLSLGVSVIALTQAAAIDGCVVQDAAQSRRVRGAGATTTAGTRLATLAIAMMRMASPMVVLSTLAFASIAHAAEGELVARPTGSTAANYGHLEYLPPGYAADGAKHPVLVFLHGSGESGDGITDLEAKMKAHGPAKLIAQGSTYFADAGMLVFVPQSPEWWNPDGIHAFLDYLATNFRIDPRRVYLTGLSMGGGGTWSYASSHPHRATAILPICGAAGPGDGAPLVGVPTWAFHAWGDGTVPSSNSVGWADHIADAIAGVDVPPVLTDYPHVGGDVNQAAAGDMTATFDGAAFAWAEGTAAMGESNLRLTLYPDGSHDSWTRTYDQPAIWDWFIAQRKPAALDDDRYIVDNLDAGASFVGEWACSQAVEGYYWWDEHEIAAGPDVSASFTATLPPARYEVYVSWAAGPDRGSVDASIDGATTPVDVVTLDQTQGGGFTSIGSFDFADGTASVTLRPTEGTAGVLVADAVGFVYRDELPAEGTSSGGAADDSGGGDGGGEVGGDPQGTGGGDTTAADASDSSGSAGANEGEGGCACTLQREGTGGLAAAWLLLAIAGLRRRR